MVKWSDISGELQFRKPGFWLYFVEVTIIWNCLPEFSKYGFLQIVINLLTGIVFQGASGEFLDLHARGISKTWLSWFGL